jgi:alpha-ketoglutarate-dependent taurine dioxygenase
MSGPFDLADDAAYRSWRERKLAEHPRRAEDLIVEIGDPKRLTAAERAALIDRCARANMALYFTRAEVDKAAVRALGRQLGLERLDRNWLADEDGVSSITLGAGTRGEFIPYTERALGWHTDGVYNTDERRIHAMALHCVRNAAEGGESAFVDHEIVWLLLRDESPDYARALFAVDAMSVPPRYEDGKLARPEQSGPVYSVVGGGAGLHMRYSGRGTNIAWKDDAATRDALAFIARTLEAESPFIIRLRLSPGMGIVCNNVLHKRSAFRNEGDAKRLLFRARYLDRVAQAEEQHCCGL